MSPQHCSCRLRSGRSHYSFFGGEARRREMPSTVNRESLTAPWYTSRMILLHRASLLSLLSLVVFSFGCAAGPQPAYLTVEQSAYARAFDVAGEVARSYGMTPALRDRRSGIIETQPAIAGTLLEPWDRATRTFEQAAESTLSFQRRRARFEFQPAGFSQDVIATDAEVLAGPDLLAIDEPLRDLTAEDGPLELRVWVYNERAHVPGIRRSAWSRRLTTRTLVIDPETSEPLVPAWTVVSRDRELESHLLTEIERALDRETVGR